MSLKLTQQETGVVNLFCILFVVCSMCGKGRHSKQKEQVKRKRKKKKRKKKKGKLCVCYGGRTIKREN